jgi:hypothetical protein
VLDTGARDARAADVVAQDLRCTGRAGTPHRRRQTVQCERGAGDAPRRIGRAGRAESVAILAHPPAGCARVC